MKVECPNCGKRNHIKNNFCGECGTKLPPVENYCPDCDKTYVAGEKFCTECGKKLVNQEKYEKEEIERIERENEEEKRLKLCCRKIEENLIKSQIHGDVLINRIYDGPSNNASRSSKIMYLLGKYSCHEIKVMIDNAEDEIIDEKVK